MTKTYNIIAVRKVDINLDDYVEFVIDAVREKLYDNDDIEYDEQESFYKDLMKEIAKEILKTY